MMQRAGRGKLFWQCGFLQPNFPGASHKIMIKLLTILLIGLVFESAGIVFLKKGMDQINKPTDITVHTVGRLLKDGATSPQILLGIFFQALFFACLLTLMSKSDISFLWPLTALSFVFTTFSAMLFLGERVSAVRWVGVVFI